MSTYQYPLPPTSADGTMVRDYLARSLTALQSEELRRCQSHLQRSITNRPPIYTGLTALKLCCIELPWHPGFSNDALQVLYSDRNQRPTRNHTRYLPWHIPDDGQTKFANIHYTQDDTSIICTHPVVTWAVLARILSQSEVIVLADSLLRGTACPISITLADLRTFLKQTPDFAGKRRCLAALPFVRTITDSPMEARTVLVLLRYGLPKPQLQWKVYIPELHRTVTVDMAYPEACVIIEYDGDAHRIDRHQHRWDERKRQALRAMGFTVIVVFADDVTTVEGKIALVQRVARALGIVETGMPLPEYRVLLDDERRMAHRLEQRRYRLRQRAKGRAV
ncbi:DUF559 domain-containing protein [Bifidobacterium simiarum]|nr:DUF559 domain-containing protein [Bifidobacterium simiarum]